PHARWCVLHDSPPRRTSTLSLHDALPISNGAELGDVGDEGFEVLDRNPDGHVAQERTALHPSGLVIAVDQAVDRRSDLERCDDADRKSTRLNSSHVKISYAVFCLKKKT